MLNHCDRQWHRGDSYGAPIRYIARSKHDFCRSIFFEKSYSTEIFFVVNVFKTDKPATYIFQCNGAKVLV